MQTPPAIKKLLVMVVAVLICGGIFSAYAQEKEQPKPAAPVGDRFDHREGARDSYKLDFTFIETEGGRKVNSRTFTVMCEDQGSRTSGHLRVGSRVPVASGPAPGGGMPQFTYMDVGMRIDANLTATTDGGLTLSTTVDVSSLADASGTPGLPPVLRSMQFSANTGIIPGKPVVLTTADDMGSNRRFEVQIVATKLSR